MATVTGTKRHLGITSDTYDSNGDVVVGGNLTVEGTTTTLDTANLLVEDKNIIIGNVSSPSDTTADGGGITLKGASDYTINWVNANDRWEFNQGIHSTGNITGANLSGTNTGDQDLSGYSTSDTTYTAGNGLSLSSGNEFRMAGGSIGASVDLDTYTGSGYYVQGSNSNAASGTNWPVDKAGILTVVRAEGNTTHITQTYDQYNSNAFYNRSYYNGTWSTWRNLAQDTNTQRAISSTPTDGATTTSISSDWAFDNVKTAVPVNAVFSDTTYDLSGYLLNTTDTLTGTLTVDTGLSGTGDANRGFTATKTSLGAVHAAGGEGGTTTSADTTPMITIPGNTAGQVQGGIYASQNSSTGTSISIFTTDSYSTGPQQSLTVLDNGNVSVDRGTLTIGDGTADTRLIIKRVDGDDADDIQFFNGTTRVGEIGTQDTTWLRINQETAKNIYTPRYMRADGGFFVDGTSKGVNGSGNFIGGTITGASDANVANWDAAYSYGDHAAAGYVDDDSYLLKSNADDTFTGRLSVGSTNSRRAGIYGIYDSFKTGHIWSMGTGYMIPSNGSDFGNLYGFAYKHTNNTTGGTMGGGHQAVWCTGGTPRASIGESGIWTSGNVTHTGLTMTDGTDIDQIKSYTKSLTLTSSWQDTGVNGAELATGTYTIQVTVNNSGANGYQYDEMYSGTMTWYGSNTNSTDHDEIVLHAAGHARNGKSIFLRTLRTVSSDANDLKLQIRDNRNATQTASNYIFKFRRLI